MRVLKPEWRGQPVKKKNKATAGIRLDSSQSNEILEPNPGPSRNTVWNIEMVQITKSLISF
jgi:hypothetical protein